MDKAVIEEIKSRQRKLKQAGKELKEYFVGIDDIIDNILKQIETWYVMPELLSRPAIICLWGPTGVGKTDLVRRLVKCLHVQDRFCEMTLSNKGSNHHPWASNIGAILRSSNIQSGSPNVLMLDEVQGFRTIDEEGHDIHDCKFKDVWTLLSDGKLPYHVEMEGLMGMLWDMQKKEIMPSKTSKQEGADDSDIDSPELDEEKLDDDYDEEEDEINERWSFYQLNYFKTLLRLDEPICEIALWSDAKRKSVIIQRLTDKSIFEEEDFTKSLIFISGNLDEAYGFAKDTKEVDADADILHEMSKKINILDIKEALTRRFKPEQISRMGNSHIIYPSLSKKSFETIIERKITSIQERVKSQTDVDLIVDPTINELIYNNGVFPTQGTRPVFSTISDILENSLPNFLLKAIINGTSEIRLDYKDSVIRCNFDGGKVIRKYTGSLDRLKDERRKNLDRRTLTAVHEAGHAVSFAILFGMAPSQIVGSPASNDTEGFVYTIQSCQSKDMAIKRLCVMLGGQVAEKIVFGKDNVTSGSGSDLQSATEKAAKMIRRWGMGNFASVIARKECDSFNNDIEGSNDMIEAIVRDCKTEVEEVLLRHLSILKDTVDALLVVDKLTSSEFMDICKKHGLSIGEAKSSEDTIYWNYHDKYQQFREAK